MTIALTHYAMHVEDVEATVAFYLEYARMVIVRKRQLPNKTIYWLAQPGKQQEFIFVVLPGGRALAQRQDDFSHLGFAVASKQEVDELAAKAQTEGILVWPPRQEPYPVGYYCGVSDPNGLYVEFSYGQPLGPGAELAEAANPREHQDDDND